MTNIMNMKPLLLCVLIALAATLGCQRRSSESQTVTDKPQTVKVYSEAELNRLILPGMTTADVTNKFGSASAVNIMGNWILLTYMFSFEDSQKSDPHMIGFGIDIKEGRVVRWSPVTGMTGATVQGGESQGTFDEQPFSIYLAADNSVTNIVSIVESQGSADASRLKMSPDLTFKAKVFAGDSGSGRPGEQSVILVVSDQDASKLKDLTEDSFGKRLIIVCHNKVIAAPAISSPLGSKQILFTVKDPTVLDALRGN